MTVSPPIGLAPDPLIPMRDVLLDADAVAERLSRIVHGESAIVSCHLRRAKYRLGESLRVVYDVVSGGRAFVASARTFADSAQVFHQASMEAKAVAGLFGVAHDPQTQTVWWTVPNDRRLHNLATLLDPPQRVREASGVAWDRSALVEYSPEASATARVLDANGDVVAYAKAFRARDGRDVADGYNRVAAALAPVDGVQAPRAFGWARTDRIVVLEPMPGISWSHLGEGEQPAALHRLGTAVAEIHDLPIEFGATRFQRYRTDRVAHSAELVATARPDVADAAMRLRDRLAGGPPNPTETVYLHGDVHANNVLFHDDQVNMIDFDQGGTGAAAADIASMLASLITMKLTNPGVAAGGLGAAFVDGYRQVRPLPSAAELRWYTAAALVVERAIRAVNRVYRPSLAVLDELFDRAEGILAGEADIHD